MQYLALIYTDETKEANASEAERNAVFAAYMAFDQAVRDAGVYLGGNALKPTDTATTVRVRGGDTLTVDGPFAETKEQLGGYYLLQCKDLDEALKWAAKIPSASIGSIEVRPIMQFG